MGGKAKRMTIDVLQSHFHLPMADVARKFEVCPTYFKRICRSHGIMRWPYRKLKSMKSKEEPGAQSEPELTQCNNPLTPSMLPSAGVPLRLKGESWEDIASNPYQASDPASVDFFRSDDSDDASSTTVPSSPDHNRHEGDMLVGLKRKSDHEDFQACDTLCALASLARGNGSGPVNKKPCWDGRQSSQPAVPRPKCDSSFLISGQLPMPAFLQTTPEFAPNQFSRASGSMTMQLPPLSQLLSH